ncbi:MAG: DEAD/DEAH box helicase, partial [Nanoarchaeota archaeon]|nr:DEAD/DEAH box helicase [Nanoarchaeota archaeon]
MLRTFINMDNFKKLSIIEPILKYIKDSGFKEPTEIQEKTIPLILKGKDVIAGSATGSGKTLAFGAGIIQNCEKRQGVQSIVLVPTRELAEQVKEELRKFSRYSHLDIDAVYGGTSINHQIRKLQKTDVVVGTPGRVLDHLRRKTMSLDKVKILVLDEADRMLDMGFIEDIERIIRQCPKHRQTLLFSATIDKRISHLAQKYMNHPTEVSAESFVDPNKLKQVYYPIHNALKLSLLIHLLKNEKSGLVMVFCNSQRNTDFVEKNLRSVGLDVLGLHGGFSQNKRTSVMKKFSSNKAHILVCTEVAARGLDIKAVSHIYNYDIPLQSKEYVHRIGRTARAGENGRVVNLLSDRDHDNFRRVQRDYDFKIERVNAPYVQKLEHQTLEDFSERKRGRRDYGKP